MLEQFFSKPETCDRIRQLWIGKEIEAYIEDLTRRSYAARNVHRRVPILIAFSNFASARGVKQLAALPTVASDFVQHRITQVRPRRKKRRAALQREIGGPVKHFIEFLARSKRIDEPKHGLSPVPFVAFWKDYMDFLRDVRGLKDSSLYHDFLYLGRFEFFLKEIALDNIQDLTPAVLSAFITAQGGVACKSTMQTITASLRRFLRYLFLQGAISKDLSQDVHRPVIYRWRTLPRAIEWKDIKRMLDAVDCRSILGRRDYALLVIMITYGLRSREVAALTLADIDWKRNRIHVNARKAGHSTTYPLSQVVGEAILSYLQHGRPKTDHREIFLAILAPLRPMTASAVSTRAATYLRKSGIKVHRAGSHTLRHTCAVRLLDQGFALKEIGDYLAHTSPSSTGVYAKTNVRDLRDVALSDGEELL